MHIEPTASKRTLRHLAASLIIWGLGAGIVWADGSLGRSGSSSVPQRERQNTRELCRTLIGGHYLNIYDTREQNRKALLSYQSSLQKIQTALAKAKLDLSKAQNAAKNSSFDIEIASKRDQMEAYVNTLEAQRRDAQHVLSLTEQSLKHYAAEEQRLKTLIEKVFTIERAKTGFDQGYPVELRYLAPCPKFRHLCPLPAKYAKLLLGIDLEGETPEVCQRYAGIR